MLFHGSDLPSVEDMFGALLVPLLDCFDYGISQDLLLLYAVPKVIKPLFLEFQLHQGSHFINTRLPLNVPSQCLYSFRLHFLLISMLKFSLKLSHLLLMDHLFDQGAQDVSLSNKLHFIES
jgi:hypothetical protein